jgi:hypothetical protein
MIFMDELKLNLGSRFMRNIVSKLIVKYIKKHFNCNTELQLDELKISYRDGDVVIKTNLELKLNRHDVNKMLEKINEEEF